MSVVLKKDHWKQKQEVVINFDLERKFIFSWLFPVRFLERIDNKSQTFLESLHNLILKHLWVSWRIEEVPEQKIVFIVNVLFFLKNLFSKAAHLPKFLDFVGFLEEI